MANLRADPAKRIVSDPAVLQGKPVVRGTRIPVEEVVSRLAENPDFDELQAAFPRLTVEDIRACLEFAADRVRSA